MVKRHYFDHAASTPVDGRVLAAMRPYFSEKFGNAGSLHSFGQEAMAAVDRARETIAGELGAGFRDIIFTSSATEANNLALRGAFITAKKYFEENGIKGRPKIILSAVEHESILAAARRLEEDGAEVFSVPVDREGIVKTGILRRELDERTFLVSVMFGNNETGAIQPVAEIGKLISGFRKDAGRFPSNPYPLFHSDAAQAFQYLACEVDGLGVDLLTISSQKIYGPKGAGALFAREISGVRPLRSILSGGGQEFGFRPGTENVPAIAGFAEAVKIAAKMREGEARRVFELRKFFLRQIKKNLPKSALNGDRSGERSLPHIVNVFLGGRSAEEALVRLDLAGFAVSAGSACKSRRAEPSHVLLAMGCGEGRARGSIRISFGRRTQKADIEKLIKEFKNI